MAFQMKSLAAGAVMAAAAASLPVLPAHAGAEPFIGEMMLVPYTFCPRDFAEAHGQLLPINQHAALFSLLGTNFGGDGRTTFGLPDMRGRYVVGEGTGKGLSPIALGQRGGNENTTLHTSNLAPHTHGATTTVNADIRAKASSNQPAVGAPANQVLAQSAPAVIYNAGPANVTMHPSAIESDVTATTTVGSEGGGQSFSNRPPFLGLRWCIALDGIFPSRN